MELLPKNSIFEFNQDTLQYLRHQYDLDKPGRIEEAINLLEEWIQKQPHFMKKDFGRDYLERTIIICKGSLERAKVKLDKICTFRTIYPQYFGPYDIKKSKVLDEMQGVFLPKLTNDHYRVYAYRSQADTLDEGLFAYYRYFLMQCEYIQAYDYCNGLVIFLDFREANLMEAVKAININELRQVLTIMREGYGMRIKGMHFVTESKAVEAMVAIFKQVFSAKIAARIVIHKTMDSINEYILKDIMPEEYGGKEKPLLELHNKFKDILTSQDFTAYMNEMNKAYVDEKLRPAESNDQDLGVPGSFRTLNVD